MVPQPRALEVEEAMIEVAGPRQQVWPLGLIHCSKEEQQRNNKPGTVWEASVNALCNSMERNHLGLT